MLDSDFETVSGLLLRNGDWISVRQGTFTVDDEKGWFSFEESVGGGVRTTTVSGLVSDVIAVKRRNDGDGERRPRRAVVL